MALYLRATIWAAKARAFSTFASDFSDFLVSRRIMLNDFLFSRFVLSLGQIRQVLEDLS